MSRPVLSFWLTRSVHSFTSALISSSLSFNLNLLSDTLTNLKPKMPGMLTRSKSLRFLRNNRREATEQDNGDSMPPVKGPQTDFDKYKGTTSDSRTEGNLGVPDTAKRPSTSGGPGERLPMFHKKTNPVASIYSQDHIPSFQSPTTSTTVLYSPDATKEQGVIGIALGSPTPTIPQFPWPAARKHQNLNSVDGSRYSVKRLHLQWKSPHSISWRRPLLQHLEQTATMMTKYSNLRHLRHLNRRKRRGRNCEVCPHLPIDPTSEHHASGHLGSLFRLNRHQRRLRPGNGH